MGRGIAAGTPTDACRRYHGLPRLGARRPPPQAGGDERAAAGNGRHAEFRAVQPRAPDLRGIEARRYREAVRKKVMRSRFAAIGAILYLVAFACASPIRFSTIEPLPVLPLFYWDCPGSIIFRADGSWARSRSMRSSFILCWPPCHSCFPSYDDPVCDLTSSRSSSSANGSARSAAR